MVTRFLANLHNTRLALVIGELDSVLRHEAELFTKASATPEKVMRYHIKMAAGDLDYIDAFVQCWFDEDVLARVGLGRRKARTEHDAKEDHLLADALVQSARCFMMSEWSSMMMYQVPPLLFAGLLGDVYLETHRTLQRCRQLWELVSHIEMTAQPGSWLASHLASLHWHGSNRTREIMIALAECKWRYCPLTCCPSSTCLQDTGYFQSVAFGHLS